MKRLVPFQMLLGSLAAEIAYNGIVTRCLSPDEIALNIYGSPGASTAKILDALDKTDGTQALFFLDATKLALGSVSSLAKSIMSRGHIVGLGLDSGMDINSMSIEGLRGTMTSLNDSFLSATGKRPLFLRVQNTVDNEHLQFLSDCGYFVTFFGLDASLSETSDCKNDSHALLQSLAPSGSAGVIGIRDSPRNCPIEVISDIVSKAGSLKIVRMDKCIGLMDPYQQERTTLPVDIKPVLPRRDVSNTAATDSAKGSGAVQERATSSGSSAMFKLAAMVPLILVMLL